MVHNSCGVPSLTVPFKRWMRVLFFLGIAFALGDNAHAQTNEPKMEFLNPIITEEVLPDEPGELTLRLGNEYRARGGAADGTLPYAEACFGLVNRLGATVNVPLAFDKHDSDMQYGLGDISARLKFLAVPYSTNVPAIVLGLETTFPSGSRSRGLGEGAFELMPYIALLKEFGPVLLQGDFDWSKQVSGHRSSSWPYNWAASMPVYQRRGYLLTELNGDWGRPNHAAIAPGFKYFFSDRFSAGAVAPIGLNRDTEAWGIVTQFQYEF